MPTSPLRLRPVYSLLAPLALVLLVAIGLLSSSVSTAAASPTSSKTHARHAKTARSRHPRRHAHAGRTTGKPAHRRARHEPVKPTPVVTPPVTAPPVVTPPSETPSEKIAPKSPEPPAQGESSPPSVTVSCDLVAAPGGSDTAGNGSLASPFQTVAKLDSALAPGQTGCLRGGVYGSINTLHKLSSSGTPSAQVTITAYPGESPTVVGWVDLEAAYTTISGLKIDGSNTFYKMPPGSPSFCNSTVSQGLDISGTGDVFEHNDYYQSVASLRGNGLGVGFWGNADNTVIRYNRLHDVGSCTQHDHLIYLASGNNVQIYDNWMYNDHNGFGVTVYPHPTNARIYSNVMDATGMGLNFGDDGTSTIGGNEAWNNVVTNSVKVLGDSGGMLQAVLVMCSNLDSSSISNKVFNNDSFNNPDGNTAVNSHLSAAQISVTGTVSVNPGFVDAAAHDYDVPAGSPVASWGLWNGEAQPSTPTASSRRAHTASTAGRRVSAHSASVARRRAHSASVAKRRRRAAAAQARRRRLHKSS
jgi:hypothetical protein